VTVFPDPCTRVRQLLHIPVPCCPDCHADEDSCNGEMTSTVTLPTGEEVAVCCKLYEAFSTWREAER
jgi:predicted amidophosphoribosyltransferase